MKPPLRKTKGIGRPPAYPDPAEDDDTGDIFDIRTFDKFMNHGGVSDAARKQRSEIDDQE
ncbi:MAG: hypothetical protein KDJ69_12125 [Nitratireductor sp.]|nr:hypothetical protein [Nitratireductor sp.]